MGISIVKKLKEALKVVSSVAVLRTIFILASLIIQFAIIFAAVLLLDKYVFYFYGVCSIASLIISLQIVNSRNNPAYQTAWIILILFLPLFGVIIYLVLGREHLKPKVRKGLKQMDKKTRDMLYIDDFLIERISKTNPDAANQMKYLYKFGGFPVYKGTAAEFLSPGEVKFKRMKEELNKAKLFIFIEYFIIADGIMWQEILEILKKKAQEGVEVRVMYDDFGSLLTLPGKYGQYLNEHGIQHCVFGKMIPAYSALLNHRDHRKILVIDGNVGFTGGINIADEYINKKKKHGYWKDASIMLKGEAVWSLTVFFLANWDYVNDIQENFLQYQSREPNFNLTSDGYFQPYADRPMDKDQVGENVYLNMINRAKRYVYIESPYLVIDNEMMVSLCNAAQQGIDVRIVTPGVWDHWYVHAMTKSNYERLTESGVRIYEFTPGFLHSKIFICDDELATVGTVNMDYRSLYLHFECGVLIYQSSAIKAILKDFMDVLDLSHEYTYQECKSVPLYRKVMRGLLKVFAPLM